MSEETGWHPCLKQLTRCLISYPDGTKVEATNSCHVEGAEVCPRVTAGSKSGEGYELCGPPKHAEQEAAKLVPPGKEDGIAFLFGHTWMCMDCQHALTAAGVRIHVITGEPA
jgi:hypothetical protein